MGTLVTVNDYLTDVRSLLQDTLAADRYSDQDLVTAFNEAILESYRVRPDLWQYLYPFALPSYTEADNTNNPSTTVPIEPSFRLAFVHGIVAHAYERDQEDVEDKRAAEFMRVFYSMLGVRPLAPSSPANAAPAPTGGM